MATLTGKIEWEPWDSASPTNEERRDQWAREIAAGESSQTLSGDSMVFADFDADNDALTIYDTLIRRIATVPLPGGAEGWRLRGAAPELADALEAWLRQYPSGDHEALRLTRAALRKAGRLQ